jgi:hypothetical protein
MLRDCAAFLVYVSLYPCATKNIFFSFCFYLSRRYVELHLVGGTRAFSLPENPTAYLEQPQVARSKSVLMPIVLSSIILSILDSIKNHLF